MTTTTKTAFHIHVVPPEILERVRKTQRDVSGNPVAHVIAQGGEPVRCCVRNARPGEELILFGYEPPLPPSPYREIGAIYGHSEPCGGPEDLHSYPAEWRGRPQILRGYDSRGWIIYAEVHDGRDPEAAVAAALADPEVVQVHSRNISYGCYNFTITRAS
jgi:hypothetical protein